MRSLTSRLTAAVEDEVVVMIAVRAEVVEIESLLAAILAPGGAVVVVVQLLETHLLPKSKTRHSSLHWERSEWR